MSRGTLWALLTACQYLLLAVAGSRNQRVRRSLWAGTPILTLGICARAERLLGVKSDSLVFQSYFVTSEFTFNLAPWRRGPRWWKGLLHAGVFLWACIRYQRFHFFCDRGILPPLNRAFNEWEMKTLKWLGKQIFFYAYGADVRTRRRTEALGPFNCCTECPNPGAACVCDEAEGALRQSVIARYATATFSMGDMIHYSPGSRNDLYYWPVDLDAEEGRRYAPRFPDPRATGPLRVVHAPNHRGFKGTHFLLEAVQRLQAEGLPIELVLVERVPNREALEIYRTADIVFDQCLVGFHGYFALEALAMGKPVMVHIRDPRQYLIDPDACPFINTPADGVEQALRRMVRERPLLHQLGVRGRRYIEKHHSLGSFAARLDRVYKELAGPHRSGRAS